MGLTKAKQTQPIFQADINQNLKVEEMYTSKFIWKN